MTSNSRTPQSDGRRRPGGTPTWVKIFAIITLVVLVLFVISLVAGVQHGPGQHSPAGGTIPAAWIS